MNRNSLRARVTAFYLAMLGAALVFFSIAVYAGVRRYLTLSVDKTLNATALKIIADYLVPLDSKGQAWFQAEMDESYPPGVSDPFVRVSRAGKVLYQSGDLRDPRVRIEDIPLPNGQSDLDSYRTLTASTGQPLTVYATSYRSPGGDITVVETGSNMEPLGSMLHSLAMILLITTPAILTMAAVGGFLLMARPLRPVVALTEQTEHVGRTQMGERLTVIRSGDELERLSLALNRMIDRLEEALAHNQRFSADASHELRTPLTIMHGELEALLQIPELPAHAMEGVSSALEECDRMASIVHSLMMISRLDSGGERMDMCPLELGSILRVTLEHMSLLAEEKNIKLTVDAAQPAYVMGDAMRLKQVIVNLVDNAIRYTPDGGRIVVHLCHDAVHATLTVSDTGIGIPEAALPFVFDRFYRTDEARSRESGGTGLGLAIVKAICGAHAGTISIESVEGKKTTLRLQLPVLNPTPRQVSEIALAEKKRNVQAPVSDGSADGQVDTGVIAHS